MYKWKLTDQEIEECNYRGVSLGVAQAAKKQAYIHNGGIILNPDSLYKLYEALLAVYTGISLQDVEGGSSELNIRVQQALAFGRGKSEIY